MKSTKFSEEQILKILREVESSPSVELHCRQHGISTATYYNWKQKYGDMDVESIKRLRQLESENARLKKLLADKSLDYDILKEGYELIKKL